MQKAEAQWLGAIGNPSAIQIRPILTRFDNDPRVYDGSSYQEVLERYIPFSQIAHDGLHGLIVTGANLEIHRRSAAHPEPELMPWEGIHYADQLAEIVDWAHKNVRFSIYSCLASHFALKHLYGIEREFTGEKIFGVYEHELTDVKSDFTSGMDDKITAPHSRWGNISPGALGGTAIKMLAVNEQVGWLLAQGNNNAKGSDLFIQGHPEYHRRDLAEEYRRDLKHSKDIPANYFPDDNPHKSPALSWASDARALYSNWIDAVYRSYSL
jgi:homoserine O-succinyltransferase